MKMKTGIKVVLVFATLFSLTACRHQTPYQEVAAVNDADAYYGRMPEGRMHQKHMRHTQTAGLGTEQQFAEEKMASQDAKRIFYFDFDSNVVHEKDKPAILANANYLLGHPNKKIILEGHTDPRGSREYNIGLGERRANAVAAILKAKGVGQNQIRIVSYGAQKLAANGRTEQDYQLDRRGVIVYFQR